MFATTGLGRWVWRSAWLAASITWGVLFYRNYWQASIPAFGDVAVHTAALRLLLVKYSAVGVALAASPLYGWYSRRGRSSHEKRGRKARQAGLQF